MPQHKSRIKTTFIQKYDHDRSLSLMTHIYPIIDEVNNKEIFLITKRNNSTKLQIFFGYNFHTHILLQKSYDNLHGGRSIA